VNSIICNERPLSCTASTNEVSAVSAAAAAMSRAAGALCLFWYVNNYCA
jgi:hypothetical protein